MSQCLGSGQSLVIELPGHRLVSTQALGPTVDDSLVDERLESNPSFRAMVEKPTASPRRPFTIGDDA